MKLRGDVERLNKELVELTVEFQKEQEKLEELTTDHKQAGVDQGKTEFDMKECEENLVILDNRIEHYANEDRKLKKIKNQISKLQKAAQKYRTKIEKTSEIMLKFDEDLEKIEQQILKVGGQKYVTA